MCHHDRQEQYSWRNCLLIHGLPKNRNENTDLIVTETLKEKMAEEIIVADLDRTHRLGPKEDRVRSVIVKCARYNTRSRVFRNKTKLKGKKHSITESLTKMQMHPRSLNFTMFKPTTEKSCTKI